MFETGWRARGGRRRATTATAVVIASFFGMVGAASATTVSGTPYVGSTLTAMPDTTGDAVDWYRCDATGTILPGATPVATQTTSYTVASGDVGSYLCAQDVPAMTVGVSSAAASNPPPPMNSDAPTLSTATPQVGQPISVSTGTWNPTPTNYAYQWIACRQHVGCSAIRGATQATYTPGAGDAGATLDAAVTAYDYATASSAAYAGSGAAVAAAPIVAPAAPANQAAPTISGTAAQGQTLKVTSTGRWSDDPTAYSYQWEHCALTCTAIAGATGTSYRLTDADVGDALAVAVTAANAGGSASATSAHTAIVSASTSTALVAAPTTVHINQPVMLTAVITSSADTADPSGTVTFDDGGSPVSGCADQPVSGSTQSITVSCSAGFGLSTPSLTATFTPGTGAPLSGSSSAAQPITVQSDPSTTTLDVPSEVKRGASVTYTATVQPADNLTGPVVPGGRVRFSDHGHAIHGCIRAKLQSGAATCTVTYAGTGSHRISARYDGTSSFTGSASRAKTVQVVAVLPRAHGHVTFGSVTATMQWTFHFTPSYTRILAFVLHGLPAHSEVTITCAGRGCPFHAHSHRVARTLKQLNIDGAFHHRRLHVHASVVVTVTRTRYVGKYYRFTIMPRRQPAVRISCLAPGSTRPGVGCRA